MPIEINTFKVITICKKHTLLPFFLAHNINMLFNVTVVIFRYDFIDVPTFTQTWSRTISCLINYSKCLVSTHKILHDYKEALFSVKSLVIGQSRYSTSLCLLNTSLTISMSQCFIIMYFTSLMWSQFLFRFLL